LAREKRLPLEGKLAAVRLTDEVEVAASCVFAGCGGDSFIHLIRLALLGTFPSRGRLAAEASPRPAYSK